MLLTCPLGLTACAYLKKLFSIRIIHGDDYAHPIEMTRNSISDLGEIFK